MKFRIFLLLIGFFLSLQALAQGGPPMITDDPYTVGNNKWEINIAQLGITDNSHWQTQSPYFDVNYGVGDQIQLKYESGISILANAAIPYGGPYADAGMRWKFYQNESAGMALSTYPQYTFSPGYYAKNTDVDRSETSLFLPIEFSKRWGDFAVNPEVGYGFVNGDEDFWSVGLLVAEDLRKGWSIMAEIHEIVPVTDHGVQSIFNVGTSFDLNETFTILASVGTSFAQSPEFLISYLGLQIHL